MKFAPFVAALLVSVSCRSTPDASRAVRLECTVTRVAAEPGTFRVDLKLADSEKVLSQPRLVVAAGEPASVTIADEASGDGFHFEITCRDQADGKVGTEIRAHETQGRRAVWKIGEKVALADGEKRVFEVE